jgi:hypothetical protein
VPFGRRLLVAALVSGVAIAVVLTAVGIWLSAGSREWTIAAVEQRFDRRVELESLSVRFLPGLRAVGHDLVIHQKPEHEGLPPFISIQTLMVDVSIWDLLGSGPPRVDTVELDGLRIHVPTGDDRDDRDDPSDGDDRNDDGPGDGGNAVPPFVIDKVLAPGTKLFVHPDEPGKEPLLWDIRQLSLESAGTTEPMLFDAVLYNAKPPGLVRSTGSFGPWNEREVGRTPVSGEYTFDDADLSALDGISGILSSEGRYEGVLERLDVEGTTNTPEFSLGSGGNSVPLRTEFVTVVDGTNGDTLLAPVRAWLGETQVVASGAVVHRGGVDGKTIELEVEVMEGRIEDFLLLAMDRPEPFMTGDITMRTDYLLPQGPEDIVEKLRLDGTFRIGSAMFTETTLQDKIDELSSRSRGEPESPRRVASGFESDFRLDSSVLTLEGLGFQVPGAEVELDGTYGLRSEQIDMKGKIHMDASLSETTTGIKSVLLNLLEPFLFGGERGNGATLPIRITGTQDEPDFGLDFPGGR